MSRLNSIDTSSTINQLDRLQRRQSNTLNQLSTGKRINAASDDASGLFIADSAKVDYTRLDVQERGASMLQGMMDTAMTAMDSLASIKERKLELATQAANGTVTNRTALEEEFTQLSQEEERIIASTEFNGQKLLDGSFSTSFTAGTSPGSESVSVQIASSSSGSSLSVASAASAQSAMDSLKGEIATLSTNRGALGASYSRLDSIRSLSSATSTNLKAAESQIRDADIAEVMARKTADSIRQEGAVALVAQAGKLNRNLGKLLA